MTILRGNRLCVLFLVVSHFCIMGVWLVEFILSRAMPSIHSNFAEISEASSVFVYRKPQTVYWLIWCGSLLVR